MKKIISFGLCICCIAVWLVGCTPSVQQQQVEPPIGLSGTVASQEPIAGTQINIFLPAGQQAIEQQLSSMAAARGYVANIQTAAPGLSYQAALLAAFAGEASPDLFWVEGQAEIEALRVAGYSLEDFSAATAPLALQTLSGMIPQALSLGQEKMVGLPLGFYGEGTLVNLSMLAALLGTEDLETLRTDLTLCSFTQWELLAEMVEDYLSQPRRLRIALGGSTYVTPRYRPTQAQKLRGIFAIATNVPEDYVNISLAATLAVPYDTPADLLAATVQQKTDAIAPVLPSLLGLVNFQTLHMTNTEGTFQRGQEFNTIPRLSSEQAAQMFQEGTALFLVGDTRLGQTYEQVSGAYQNIYALIPTKLPQNDNQDNVETEEATNEEDRTTDIALAAQIGENNTYISVRTEGYLCINAASSAKAAAEALLTELCTSEAGRNMIEQQLHLLPVGPTLPTGQLAYQLSMDMSAGYYNPVVAGPFYLTKPESEMGQWIDSELMGKAEWTVEDTNAFVTMALSALGLPLGGMVES